MKIEDQIKLIEDRFQSNRVPSQINGVSFKINRVPSQINRGSNSQNKNKTIDYFRSFKTFIAS